MPELTAQEESFYKSQIESLHRLLRVLEVLATSPIGLVTDLNSLRASINIGSAEEERERTAFRAAAKSGTAKALGIQTARLALDTLKLLNGFMDHEEWLPKEWAGRASKVLERIIARLGSEARMNKVANMEGVYVILSVDLLPDADLLALAGEVIDGGASALQLRDKTSSRSAIIETAKSLAKLCADNEVLFIVNDYPDIAAIAGADGVHLGQQDGSTYEARKILSPGQLIGRSANMLQEALEAEASGADYVVIGSLFTTDTKPDRRPAEISTLREVARSLRVPVGAIGGITSTNMGKIPTTTQILCVASAVTTSDNPKAMVKSLNAFFN